MRYRPTWSHHIQTLPVESRVESWPRYLNRFVLLDLYDYLLTPSQYSLSPDPQEWGSNLDVDLIEADDYLHTPKRHSSMQIERGGRPMSIRGLSNVGCLIFLSLVLLGLFCGYPVVFYVQHFRPSTKGGFNIGGTNASGQVCFDDD